RSEYRLASLNDRRDPPRGAVWVASAPAFGRVAQHGSPFWASPDVPLTGRGPRRAETGRVGLLTTIRWIIAALQLWRERAHSRQQLRECSYHLLKDIGLRREQLGYEYPKPYSHGD